MEGIGEKIKELRKSKNVSQEELAFALKVSRQTINKWEANAMQPNMESITALCKYFEVKYEFFVSDGKVAEEAAAAEDNGGEVQAKGKDKRFIICLSLLIVCSVAFVLCLALSFNYGILAFSPNTGYVVVSNYDNSKIAFAISLVGGLISLGVSIIAIFLLKKFKK
ncbi:MAG: helix-turn-helix domain-containing protein [Clostridia bacterium]|nr:helix-turn-helix domain-containing protein [Clostridia bacterium]